jgi:type IX secretion system PorP/SprF family membrane protein
VVLRANKKIGLFLCLSAASLLTSAQQDAQFSQYMFNYMSINPGYAGSNEMVCINSLYRNQFVGLIKEGAPNDISFSANAPFKLFEKKFGAGLSLLNDNIGFYKDLAFRGAGAYRLKFLEGTLGIGFGLGFYYSNLTPKWVTISGENGSYTSQSSSNDPLIPDNQSSKPFIFDIDFGLFYKSNKTYIGISSTHILNPAVTYSGMSDSEMPSLSRHYYISAGYTIAMPNPLFELAPSFLLQTDAISSALNFNTNIIYNNRFWGGFSYKWGSNVSGLIGMELFSGIRIGYSYDFQTTILNKVSSGSHEISVVYSFKLSKEKIPQRYKSIRFL